jgi:heme exporter protein B
MTAFLAVVRRDLRLSFRQGWDSLMAAVFFVLAVVLFPFGVGPEPNLLSRMAAGVIWVAALLASMLALERLFQADYEDGSLELMALSPLPLEAVVLAKVLVHWLTTAGPLLAAAPLLALLLGMAGDGFPVLMLSLLVGTPALGLVGSVGAGLILGARRGGVLLALLILPLFVPVLIFGAAAVEAALAGLTPGPHLSILAGLAAAALALCPWAAAAAVRQALE